MRLDEKSEQIVIPDFYGVVFRKTENVRANLSGYLTARKEFIKNDAEKHGIPLEAGYHDETDNLISFSVAMNLADCEAEVRELLSKGLVDGVDFVITSQMEGVISKSTCDWLRLDKHYLNLID